MAAVDIRNVLAGDGIKKFLNEFICMVCHDLPINFLECATGERACRNFICSTCILPFNRDILGAAERCASCREPDFKVWKRILFFMLLVNIDFLFQSFNLYFT